MEIMISSVKPYIKHDKLMWFSTYWLHQVFIYYIHPVALVVKTNKYNIDILLSELYDFPFRT